MSLSIAYWCVLVGALLPYVWVGVAKTRGQRYNNRDPRGWLARQDNPLVQQANAAQLNAFEAFAPFASGVVMAQLAGVAPATISTLALAFVALRIAHGLLYLANQHGARSLVWFGGLACVTALLVQAALQVAG